MQWDTITYSKNKAENKFQEIVAIGQKGLSEFRVTSKHEDLRNDFISIQDKIFEKYSLDNLDKQGYLLDLSFGLETYVLLKNSYNFTLRDASNDDVWRFLQMEIVPDIVFIRWGGFNAERFYSSNRRLWLKSIWWYVHLSWKNSVSETFDILKDNSTDTIMQLIERPGQGYNLGLYREIMHQYHSASKESATPRRLFRQVLILNNARTAAMSPELSEGEIAEYVSTLFKDVEN